jgi:trk system potassium uptake protein TrkH
MRFDVIIRYVGLILLINAVFMLISALVSIFNNWDTGSYPLLLSCAICAIAGIFPLIFVERNVQISTKEGYVIVVGSWLLSCVAGMLPYVLWGGEFSFINAWFESVSGFTTTGATILVDIEALPNGLLFWRSATHWIGGVGVVLFSLVILPTLGRTKAIMSNVELSSLAKENFRYRTQKILLILTVVYIGLTLLQTLLLKVAGMNWFDSINHAFSTISTGGFSTKNLSIGAYNNIWIDIICIIFMLIASIHFGLIFSTFIRNKNNIFRSEVVRFYVLGIAAMIVCLMLNLKFSGNYATFGEALRYSSFQVVSVISTTGFATANTNLWTPFAILVLIYCGLQCGCAGSTTGGLKADRILLLFKALKVRIIQQQHPNAVVRVKLDGLSQENSLISSVTLYIVFYVFLALVGGMLISLTGEDLMTSFSAGYASLGNVGPGFGKVGSVDNFSTLSVFAKMVCTMLMLLGRLEIFGFIHLLFLHSWR